MNIGVDIDNVLNNLAESVLKVYNADANDNVTLQDVKSYDMSLYVKPEYKKYFPDYYYDGRVWACVEPDVEGFKVVNELHKRGHDIFFVTATHPNNVKNKYMWLQPYCEFDTWDKLIVCHNKRLIKLDMLIDDYEQNLNYREGYCVLFNQPWNEDKNVDAEVWDRVLNWRHFRQKFIKGGLML